MVSAIEQLPFFGCQLGNGKSVYCFAFVVESECAKLYAVYLDKKVCVFLTAVDEKIVVGAPTVFWNTRFSLPIDRRR